MMEGREGERFWREGGSIKDEGREEREWEVIRGKEEAYRMREGLKQVRSRKEGNGRGLERREKAERMREERKRERVKGTGGSIEEEGLMGGGEGGKRNRVRENKRQEILMDERKVER